MSGMLPTVFAVLASGALLVALVALWQSLRVTFGAGEIASGAWTAQAATDERQALVDEKESLLRNIKDLEFEHQVGKISDADYERLDRSLRARAREVLQLLDEDLGPYRERAEALIRKHLEKSLGTVPYREAAEAVEDDTRTCPECGTSNDPDAKFCKQCASSLESKAQAETEAKANGDAEAKAEAEAEGETEAKAETEAEGETEAKAEEGSGEGEADDAKEEDR